MSSYSFDGPTWSAGPITWSFASYQYPADAAAFPFSRSMLPGVYEDAVTRAIQEWASVSGLAFQQVPDSPGAADAPDIRIGFGLLDTAHTGTIGETKVPRAATFTNDVVVRFEDPTELPIVSVGGDLVWSGYTATFYQVVLHELGHALGLGHATDPTDVMYSTATSLNRDLNADDIAGIRALYPELTNQPSPTRVALHGAYTDYVIAQVSGGQAYISDKVAGRDGVQTVANAGVLSFSDGSGLFDPTGTGEDVTRLYEGTFGRAPDLAGLQGNTALITSGTLGIGALAASFVTSPESLARYGQTDTPGFVGQLYQNVLHRTPNAAEQQLWVNDVNATSRGAALLAFSDSQENHKLMRPVVGDLNDAEATRLYRAAFNRAPDDPGLAQWSGWLQQGASVDQVAQGFVDSREFASLYGNLDANEFVTQLYSNVLQRAPDAAGKQGWLNQLASGATRAHVLAGFADSNENRVATAGATHDAWVFVG